MKLIALVIEEYGDLFKNEILSFSTKYKVHFDFKNGSLRVCKNDEALEDFYGNRISGITAIVGENGVGKTQILNILGQRLIERDNITINGRYFMVYLTDENLIIEVRNVNVVSISLFNRQAIEINSIDKPSNLRYYNYFVNLDNLEIAVNKQVNFSINYINKNYEYFFNKLDQTNGLFFPRVINDDLSVGFELIYQSFNFLKKKKLLSENKVLRFQITTPDDKVVLESLRDNWLRRIIPDEEYLNLRNYCRLFSKVIIADVIGEDAERYFDIEVDKELNNVFLIDKFWKGYNVQKIQYEILNYFRVKYSSKIEELWINLEDSEMEDFIYVITNEMRIEASRLFSQEYYKDFIKFMANDIEPKGNDILLFFKRLIRNFYLDCCRDLPRRFEAAESDWSVYFKTLGEILEKFFYQIESGNIDLSTLNLGNLRMNPEKIRSNVTSSDISDYIHETIEFIKGLYECREFLKIVNSNGILSVKESNTQIQSLLRMYDHRETWINFPERGALGLLNPNNLFFNIEIILSTGEHNLLFLFSKLKKGDSIILIDEIEEGFHLEWSRRLIDAVIEYGEKELQLIFNTHSPFMLSDLKIGDVIILKKEQGKTVVKEHTNTFAKNIQEIMNDDMFIANIYGDFALSKINSLIKELREEKVENSENLLKEINMIGEPILRNKLLDMYHQKFDTSEDLNRTLLDKMNLTTEERQKILDILDKKNN